VRGVWYTTSNLASNAQANKPDHYDLLALGGARDHNDGSYLLSGLQPWRQGMDYTYKDDMRRDPLISAHS
jgi:hypothetical protein